MSGKKKVKAKKRPAKAAAPPLGVESHLDSRNVGHGHVNKRPDGHLARCGGPGLCGVCSTEKAAESRCEKHAPPRESSAAIAESLRDAGLESVPGL